MAPWGWQEISSFIYAQQCSAVQGSQSESNLCAHPKRQIQFKYFSSLEGVIQPALGKPSLFPSLLMLDWVASLPSLFSWMRNDILSPRTWDLPDLAFTVNVRPMTPSKCCFLHSFTQEQKRKTQVSSCQRHLLWQPGQETHCPCLDLLLLRVLKSGLVSKHHQQFHCKNRLEKSTLHLVNTARLTLPQA